MKTKILTFLILSLSFNLGFCQNPEKVEEVFNEMRKYVVSIGIIKTDTIKTENELIMSKKYNSIGSGLMTYVKYDGLTINCVITAGHVVDFYIKNKLDYIYVRPSWADTMKITDYFGIQIPVKNQYNSTNVFLYPESHVDLGCIVIWPYYINQPFYDKIMEHGNKMYPMQGIKTPHVGSQVWICGYPGHIVTEFQNTFLYNISTFKPGHITWKPSESIINKDLNHLALVESNASYGNSGGPVFNIYPNIDLVGILVGGYSDYDSIYLNGKPVVDPTIKKPFLSKTRSGVSIIEKGEYVKKLIEHVESKIKN